MEALNIKINDDSENKYHHIRHLKDDFFNSIFEKYPVVRITLPPSYGYIAVTQNMLHDGGTNNQNVTDFSFLIGTKFSLISVDGV
jgi:hypothetical protein